MMRRLSYLLLVLVLVSCTGMGDFFGRQRIELTLYCDDLDEITKAGQDGVKDGVDARYNENYMDKVDFFFYPGNNPDRSMNATYHIRFESGKRGSDVFRIEVDSDIINNLIFPTATGTQLATVYAIVNYHGTLVADENNLTGTSMNDLESIIVESEFASASYHAQEDFLMSGKEVIQLIGRKQIMTATGSVGLARYACKLTTAVKVSDRIELSNGEVWVPMLEGMEIYLVNGVKTVALSGEDSTPEYFSYYNGRKRFVTKDLDNHYTALVGMEGDYYSTYPMYMYPQHWTYGSSDGYDREPYLKLVVPWARLSEGGFSSTQKQLYYKIVMPDDARPEFRRKFVRNNWYHINIDVGMLGAETDEAAVTIDPCTCYMVYWQGSKAIDKEASIGRARYLTVERDSIILNNIDRYEINYTTSHPVIIKPGSISATRPYYGKDPVVGQQKLGGVVRKGTQGLIYDPDTYYLEYDMSHRMALNQGEDWFYNSGTYLALEHPLNPDYTSNTFDYSPYTITFTLVHEDRPNDTRYMKDIYIKQYPAIYIETTRNSDDTFVYVGHDNLGNNDKWGKKIHTSDHWGYVYVDAEQIVRPDVSNATINQHYMDIWQSQGFYYPNAEEYHWRVVWYTGGSRDIFGINITVLPPTSASNTGTTFVIGDPRCAEIDNLRNSDSDPTNDFNNAPALYDGDQERSLKYYYPAEGTDRTVNMMAPAYHIASKCGGVEFGDLTFEQAKMRCATFQEDGFPAGRWRLPTQGEIHFIAMLSANGAFEPLFSNNSTYWSANGAVKVSSGSVSIMHPTAALSRCVYDTWYWGNEQLDNREQFVWGDAPR